MAQQYDVLLNAAAEAQAALELAYAVAAEPRLIRWRQTDVSLHPVPVVNGGLPGRGPTRSIHVTSSWVRLDQFPYRSPTGTTPDQVVADLLEQDGLFPYNSWAARLENFRRVTSGIQDEAYLRAPAFVCKGMGRFFHGLQRVAQRGARIRSHR